MGRKRNGRNRRGTKMRLIDRANVMVRVIRICWVFVGDVGVRGRGERYRRFDVGADGDERRDGEHGDGDFAIIVEFVLEWEEN